MSFFRCLFSLFKPREPQIIDTPFEQQTPEIALKMIKSPGAELSMIRGDLRTEEICTEGFRKWTSLYNVPPPLRTRERCLQAVHSNAFNLMDVPEEFLDLQMYEEAKSDYNPQAALSYFPRKNITMEMCISHIEACLSHRPLNHTNHSEKREAMLAAIPLKFRKQLIDDYAL